MVLIDTPYDGQIKVFDYKEGIDIIVDECRHSEVTGKPGKADKFYNVACAFDIETSRVNTSWYNDKDYPDCFKEFSYPFCWQFMINNYFIFGRDPSEFFEMIKKASRRLKHTFIIFIHNITFEYNNLADYFAEAGAEVFYKTRSTPLFIDVYNCQFRCTALLTHKSLAKIGHDIGYEKLKGDFDYSVPRDYNTPLTVLEYNYCYRDTNIIVKFIQHEAENYCKSINKPVNPLYIPYTQTGYVRSDIRRNFSNSKQGKMILANCALTQDEYIFMQNSFFGGYTHANFRFIGQELRRDKGQNVLHVDITSAYPWAMVTQLFPYKLTKMYNFTVKGYIRNLKRKDYAQIAKVILVNPRLKKGHIPYIPYNPLINKTVAYSAHKGAGGIVEENGKLVLIRDGAIELTVNEVDMRLILKNYDIDIDNIIIKELYVGMKKPLPYSVVSTILKYFQDKSTLKGVEGFEYDYGLSKQKINSCYGLSARALINCIYAMDDNLQVKVIGNEYKPANVLPYQWAPYITSYVREVIYGTITEITRKNLNNFVYSDTDSIFFLDDPKHRITHYIDNYNNKIIEQLKKLQLKYFNIMPTNNKGEVQYLGTLTYEDDDDTAAFCTIGAKRYYITHSDGTSDLTVSGLRATKTCKEDGVRRNGYNTTRLINKYGTINKAFNVIKDGDVSLPYVEGVDKLSNYNIRAPFEGELCGHKVARPCSFILYPQSTTLSLNKSLKAFLKMDIIFNEVY